MAQAKPFISIIIPVRNAERTLSKTFEYLENINYPSDSMEIIIADGGSSDNTIAVIRDWQKKKPYIRLVQIPDCPSPAFARNKALEVAKGEYLFFTDGDCAPCGDWIDLMLKHFERDPQIAAVGGEVYTLRVDPDNLVELWCQHFRFNMVAPRYGFITEGYFPSFPKKPSPSDIAGHKAYFFGTCNVVYKNEIIKSIGARFWDNPTGEDMDFSYQHRKEGYKFYFAPQAKVDHMHRADLKSLRKVWVAYGQAHAPLIKKYVSANTLEIIFQFLKGHPSARLPFPLKGFIYIGNFHLMHIFGVLFLIGLILSLIFAAAGIKIFTFVSILLALYFAFQYVKWNFGMEPKSKFFTWCKMKYLTNLSFIQGGLADFKKYRILCIEPSF